MTYNADKRDLVYITWQTKDDVTYQ